MRREGTIRLWFFYEDAEPRRDPAGSNLFGEAPPALRYVLDRVLTTTLALECTLSYRDATEFEHAVCLSDFGHAGVPSFTGQDEL